MLDRGLVGWLPPEAQKKKKDLLNFLSDEAFLSTNDNYISSIYYIELKITEICEQIVKIACNSANMTPNWYPCEFGYLFQYLTYLQTMSIILPLTCVELEQAPRNWVFNACQSLRGGKADEMIS